MGCVSSKLVKKEIKREILLNNGGGYVNHVVSLKSSTYGVLNLDNNELQQQQQQQQQVVVSETKIVQRSPPPEEPEVINAWELMGDLDEDGFIKRSPKSRAFVKGVGEKDVRSPLRFLNQIGSPLKVKKFGGKENKRRVNGFGYGNGRSDFSPKSILRSETNSMNSSCKAVLKLSYPVKSTRSEGFEGGDSKRSFSPLFDPELVALYEKELSEEQEQIKRIISPEPEVRKSRKSHDSETILQHYEKKCPTCGENAAVIYTTTLRGIRKTFEECNTVRSIVESYHIQMFERDISMDSGFKEELRKLTGTKEVKVPLVFVKGRLIGGVEEIVKLEEEGKLEMLFEGIPRAIHGCERCGGVRFVMCNECNGSCKVLDGEQKKMRCGECNENGLIQCPICC